MEESVWSSKYRTFKMNGTLPRGRTRETCNEVITSDLKERKISKDLAKDRQVWKFFIKSHTYAWKTDVQMNMMMAMIFYYISKEVTTGVNQINRDITTILQINNCNN